MPNFSIPLSGLEADNTALETIANNLSNLNTTGYKAETTNFQDMFYQLMGTNGAGDEEQVGSGTKVSSISTDFGDGTVSSTSVDTDAAITGNGFFVVEDSNGTKYYTRAGDFTQDDSGYLVTSNGYNVMGYSATNGTLNTTSLVPLQFTLGEESAPTATTTMSLTANLSSASADGATYTQTVNVYDSLGTEQALTFTFTKDTSAGGWDYTVTIPTSDLSSGSGTTTTLASGTLAFDSTGALTSTTPIAIDTGVTMADGASAMSINWDLASSTGAGLITGEASSSGVSATTQDGKTSGTLTSFSIGSDGTVTGTFSNGTEVLGQIVLASFGNEQGLSRAGSSDYAATIASGDAVVGAPGTGSLGTLTGGALELSNADMSTEFSNLIIAERGYQANAKSVTTFDQIEQDTINLIR